MTAGLCKMRGSESICHKPFTPHPLGESYHATVAAYSLHSFPTTARGGLTITTSSLWRLVEIPKGRLWRCALAITRWWKRSFGASLAGALAPMSTEPVRGGLLVSGGSTERDLIGSFTSTGSDALARSFLLNRSSLSTEGRHLTGSTKRSSLWV